VRGAVSGIPIQTTIDGAFRIEQGKIAEIQWFWTWAEALEAAGIEE
jgi:hypothetical protein